MYIYLIPRGDGGPEISGVLKPTHATHSFERVDLPCVSEALLIPKCNLTSETVVAGGVKTWWGLFGSLGDN